VLQVRRAGMLRVSRGFGAPETGAAFERARELCLGLGDQQHIIPTLSGLYSYHLQHDYRQAGVVAEQLLRVAVEHGSTTDLMIGRRAVGVVAFHVGDPATAIRELREALSLYNSETHAADAFVYGTDHAATAAAFLAISLWLDGRGDEALEQAQWAVDQGDSLSHLPSTAQALIYQCFIGVMERRHDVAEPVAARLIDLAGRIGFTLLVAAGRFLRAASAAHAGQAAEMIDEMYVSLEDWKATNSHSYLPFAHACLASTCGALGRHDEGLARVDEGLALAEGSGELWCAAELHRVRAVLLDGAGADDAAIVEALRMAIDIARGQGVITFDLRASCALAERHARLGRVAEALAVLGEVPPHETARGHDVEAERQLLASLSGTNGSTTPN
jgi:tetratricopeptide (TPR) repeat protein